MNKKIYENYAKLAVKIGINLQKGQDVIIVASTNLVDIVKEVTKVCYENGARSVEVDWTNDEISRLQWLNEDTDVMSEVLEWQEAKARWKAERLPCKIFIDDSDPEAFADVDVAKMAAVRKARLSVLKKYRDMEDNKNQWLIIAVPSPSWAKRVFPNLETEDAMTKLWEAIIKTMRLDTEDPVQAWEEHISNLADKSAKLNEMKLDYLTYKAANGTDLTVKLQPNHVWLSARETNLNGVDFTANMPTEEVFTMPKRDGTNGVVYSTKPLSLNGQLIENFKVTFENGKAVDVTAEKGLESLTQMLDMDESSRYLGEVALVPFNSPVNETGVLFSNTLFDENASCHFAFGSAYKNTIMGYEDMSEEDFKKVGYNDSVNHVDFMVGSDDLEIVGYDFEGKAYKIFENGVWVI